MVGNNASTITSSHAIGAATTGTYNSRQPAAGGLVGNNTGAIANSYATGAVTGGDDAYAGGLAGYSNAPISNSRASGAVVVGLETDYDAEAGGLVGLADIGAVITASFATGSVTGGSAATVGGMVGTSGDAITTSYATGSVNCNQCLFPMRWEPSMVQIRTAALAAWLVFLEAP